MGPGGRLAPVWGRARHVWGPVTSVWGRQSARFDVRWSSRGDLGGGWCGLCVCAWRIAGALVLLLGSFDVEAAAFVGYGVAEEGLDLAEVSGEEGERYEDLLCGEAADPSFAGVGQCFLGVVFDEPVVALLGVAEASVAVVVLGSSISDGLLVAGEF